MDTAFGTTRHILLLVALLAIAMAGFARTASISSTSALIEQYQTIVAAQR